MKHLNRTGIRAYGRRELEQHISRTRHDVFKHAGKLDAVAEQLQFNADLIENKANTFTDPDTDLITWAQDLRDQADKLKNISKQMRGIEE